MQDKQTVNTMLPELLSSCPSSFAFSESSASPPPPAFPGPSHQDHNPPPETSCVTYSASGGGV